jgi:hypothetical protein
VYDMYWQPARHPRAGIAIAAAIFVAWLGAVGIAFATDDSADGTRGAASSAHTELAEPSPVPAATDR